MVAGGQLRLWQAAQNRCRLGGLLVLVLAFGVQSAVSAFAGTPAGGSTQYVLFLRIVGPDAQGKLGPIKGASVSALPPVTGPRLSVQPL